VRSPALRPGRTFPLHDGSDVCRRLIRWRWKSQPRTKMKSDASPVRGCSLRLIARECVFGTAGHRFASGGGRGETRKLSGSAASWLALGQNTGFAGVQRKTGPCRTQGQSLLACSCSGCWQPSPVLFRAEEAGLSGNWPTNKNKKEKRFNTEGTEKEHPSQNTLRASREHRKRRPALIF